MSEINCSACNDLREYAPEFVQGGVTANVAASLVNNTGLNPSLAVLHEDCADLQDVNDCLIGRLSKEIDAYDVCDWKEYMEKFVPNLYETLKAMIMSMCGVLCFKSAALKGFFHPVVTHPRSNGEGDKGAGASYWKPSNARQTINFYMDSTHGDDGEQEADKDYTCIVSWCINYPPGTGDVIITAHSSGEEFTQDLEDKRGLHFALNYTTVNPNTATTLTTACRVPKGEHLVLELHPHDVSSGRGRIHQVCITWIPDFQIPDCE